jgi:hypothetical protein
MDDKATAAKIDPNTATAQECADWLAGNDGWHCEIDGEDFERSWVIQKSLPVRTYFHPYPLTLDAAAGALREPWRLARIEVNANGRALVTITKPMPMTWEQIEGPDRMTAEYRAAVAARLAGMEGRG